MKKYQMNPNYVVNQTENFNTIFSEKVDKVFIMQEVESEILHTFETPICIDDAIDIISTKFTLETFNELECRQYINELIENKILVC